MLKKDSWLDAADGRQLVAPIYDPVDGHIHEWRRGYMIPNLVTEQNPRQECITPIDKGSPVRRRNYYCKRCWKHRPMQTVFQPRGKPYVLPAQTETPVAVPVAKATPEEIALVYTATWKTPMHDCPQWKTAVWMEEAMQRDAIMERYIDTTVGPSQREAGQDYCTAADSPTLTKALMALKAFSFTKEPSHMDEYEAVLLGLDEEGRGKLRHDLDVPRQRLKRALYQMKRQYKLDVPLQQLKRVPGSQGAVQKSPGRHLPTYVSTAKEGQLWKDRSIPTWMHRFAENPVGHIRIRPAKSDGDESRRTRLLPLSTLKEILAKDRI